MDLEIGGASRFCVLLDMKNKDVSHKLQDPYGEGCVSYAWVRKWAKAFREGRTSLADDPRSERSLISDEIESIRAKVEGKPNQSGPDTARDLGPSKFYVLEVFKKSPSAENKPVTVRSAYSQRRSKRYSG
jgi:hypothetical protein